MWSREDGGTAYVGALVWLGCSTRGCGETDAMFEMRKEKVQFEVLSADKASRVFGVGEIESIAAAHFCGNKVDFEAVVNLFME